MSCFRKKLISVEFREAPQPMTDNIIRQHVWSVCSRLRETWFGIAALSPQHRGCESEMFWTCPVLPGESFCCGWWEHITTYLKGVILVWKWTFKGYIHNNSHHVPIKEELKVPVSTYSVRRLHGLYLTLNLVIPLRSSCTEPWIPNPGKDHPEEIQGI